MIILHNSQVCYKKMEKIIIWMMTKASSPPDVHQSKFAAAGLGDAKSLAASNLNQKVPQLTFRMRQEFHAAP